MRIEIASSDHQAAWATMRADLWVDASIDEHYEEIAAMLAAQDAGTTAFIARTEDGGAIGFAEASLRRDHVNGCDTSPVAFLEGIYVLPAHRRSGVAGRLLAAIEAWGQGLGCSELGSDADWENPEGHAFHEALGFAETERVIFFRKLL